MLEGQGPFPRQSEIVQSTLARSIIGMNFAMFLVVLASFVFRDDRSLDTGRSVEPRSA